MRETGARQAVLPREIMRPRLSHLSGTVRVIAERRTLVFQ
jgi:hypothetical protein